MRKIDEKSQRVKYIRALERFVKSAINLLKRDDFDKDIFEKRVIKNLEVLNKVEPAHLDQPYTKALENFATSISQLKDRDELVKEANSLEKLKSKKSYRKEKHKKRDFNDGY